MRVENDGSDGRLHEQGLPGQNRLVGFAADLDKKREKKKLEKNICFKYFLLRRQDPVISHGSAIHPTVVKFDFRRGVVSGSQFRRDLGRVGVNFGDQNLFPPPARRR